MPETTACKTIDSPVGPLTLVATDAGLREVRWGGPDPAADAPAEAPDHPVLTQAARQLAEYFSGDRTAFDVPLDLAGTPFQQAVWALLRAIPYGATTTYGALAETLGEAGKARAVGLANAKNPVAIIVPCHRVVGASGALTGFAGGLDAKAFLLRLERRHRPQQPLAAGQQADLFGS